MNSNPPQPLFFHVIRRPRKALPKSGFFFFVTKNGNPNSNKQGVDSSAIDVKTLGWYFISLTESIVWAFFSVYRGVVIAIVDFSSPITGD